MSVRLCCFLFVFLQAYQSRRAGSARALEAEVVSPETWLPDRPDHSDASVPGTGAHSIPRGGYGAGSRRHVAGT